MLGFVFYKKLNYSFNFAFLAARFSLKLSIAEPKTQYGMAKVNKNIMSQNPMVKILMNAKNPKY